HGYGRGVRLCRMRAAPRLRRHIWRPSSSYRNRLRLRSSRPAPQSGAFHPLPASCSRDPFYYVQECSELVAQFLRYRIEREHLICEQETAIERFEPTLWLPVPLARRARHDAERRNKGLAPVLFEQLCRCLVPVSDTQCSVELRQAMPRLSA